MWCDQILGNLANSPTLAREWDYLDLDWQSCRRTLRAVTRQGRWLRILLPPGHRPVHGDILHDDGRLAVAVQVKPCELIAVPLMDAARCAALTMELGNLHWPMQITASRILFPEDGPVMEVVLKHGLAFSRVTGIFTPMTPIAPVTVRVAEEFAISKNRRLSC